jgi:hypothetical protein
MTRSRRGSGGRRLRAEVLHRGEEKIGRGSGSGQRRKERTMRIWIVIVGVAACAGCAGASGSMGAGPTTLDDVKSLPFRPLWNGRDLEGWVRVLDSAWVVEDGILLSRQDPAGRREGESWLITEKDYEDFALRVEFRVSPGGNSGVFLRDPVPGPERLSAADGGKAPWDAGFEAQINAEDPNYPTGSIWEIAKAPPGLHTPGAWTEMLILVRGDRVKTWVGGKQAVDARQERSSRGGIGLQRHGTAAYRDKLIEFRRIEIAEL